MSKELGDKNCGASEKQPNSPHDHALTHNQPSAKVVEKNGIKLQKGPTIIPTSTISTCYNSEDFFYEKGDKGRKSAKNEVRLFKILRAVLFWLISCNYIQ